MSSVPYFLLLDTKKGWSFVSKPKNVESLDFILNTLTKSNGRECECVELIPIRRSLSELGYELYGDDCGMLKGFPMNRYFNPLSTTRQARRLARSGGPFGALLLFNEEGLNFEVLKKWTDYCDQSYGDESNDYSGLFEMAKEQWNERKQI